MNLRIILAFLDVTLILLLVGFIKFKGIDETPSKNQTSLIIIEKLFSGYKDIDGIQLRVDASVEIGVIFAIDGVIYTDLSGGEGVTIMKNPQGILIQNILDKKIENIWVFPRGLNPLLIKCLMQNSCSDISVKLACSNPMNNRNEFMQIKLLNEVGAKCLD